MREQKIKAERAKLAEMKKRNFQDEAHTDAGKGFGQEIEF